MKYLYFTLLFVLVLFNKEAAGQNSKAVLIDQLLSELYSKHLFNGAIVAGQKGNIIFSKGYGYSNFTDSLSFTAHTTGDGGSIAKTLTANAVLLLAEEGKLTLSAPVQQYLPNYPYENTTVQNLITHSTGGLPDYDYFFNKIMDTAILTTKSMLDILAENKPALAYPSNVNFHYDNVGFDLAAHIIELVSGVSYNQFLKKRIFTPLKMDDAFVRPALFKNWKQRKTMGYVYKHDSLQLFDIADRKGFYGGSNVWFSAADLYRWGKSFYRNAILPKSVISKTTSAVAIGSKPSYVRLGAWYGGKTENAFYYWGNVAGFYSFVYCDKKKEFAIGFMTNTSMLHWLRPQLTAALINIMEGNSYSPVVGQSAELVDKNNLQAIAGTYQIDTIGKVEIMVQAGKATMKLPTGMEYFMPLVDTNTFYVPGVDCWISFTSFKENRFQKLHWSATFLQANGKRIAN